MSYIGTSGSFGSNPLREHIGLGDAEEITRLEVYWPTSDTRQIFHGITADQFIQVTEGKANYRLIRRADSDWAD